MMDSRPTDPANHPQLDPRPKQKAILKAAEENRRAELLALFRLLLREPPKDHDFRTCPICKRYGITEI